MVDEIFTPFIGTTLNIPEEPDRLNVFLYDQLSIYADVINQKKIGIYTPRENFNGELWYYLTTKKVRNGYQAIVYIASYPNAGVSTITLTSDPAFPISNIDPNFVVTQVWGSASKPCSAIGAGDGDYFSFFGQGNTKVSFTMSDTQIVVTTTLDMRSYSGFIVIHYVRDGV